MFSQPNYSSSTKICGGEHTTIKIYVKFKYMFYILFASNAYFGGMFLH
jgi:hypothetical protein